MSITVQEVCTSSRYADRFLEALKPQHIKLVIINRKRFGACYGKKMLKLEPSTVYNFRELARLCEGMSSRFALQTERKGMIQVHHIVVQRSGRHNLSWFRTECTALEKVVLEGIETENWSSVLVGVNQKRWLFLNYTIIGGCKVCLKRCFLDTCCRSKWAARNDFPDVFREDVHLSWSSAVRETALL